MLILNHRALINEIAELLRCVLGIERYQVITYQEIFLQHTFIDPLETSLDECLTLIKQRGLFSDWLANETSLDTLLQFIFSEIIEKELDPKQPVFVELFPASQASLAKINREDSRVANRFECYFKGVELANGFEELTDWQEQLTRFEQENVQRKNE